MPDKIVVLSDRIKELSETTGTTNMHLQGASVGFSAFSEFYSNNDLVYYAITDGQYYEVGSGQFLLKAGDDELVRFPFKSDGPGATLDTDKVSWPVGVKEVYVTYPAPQSVYTAFGLSPDYNQPKESGFAFWSSANILNYDSNLVWNSGQGRMGIGVNPDHALHIGGNTAYSLVKASGFIASESGLFFPQGNGGTATYSGGRQLEHFVRNKLDDTAVSEGKLGQSTGSSSVIELSGVVDQYILLKQQIKGSVFAGPPSGCGVSCSPAYPNFRYLTLADIPDLSSLYVTRTGTTSAGNIAFWKEDNVLTDDDYLTWNDTDNKLGVGNNDPQYHLDVGGAVGITEDAHIGGNIIASGDLFVGGNFDVAGNLSYIDSNIVTIWDKHLELASMSGTAIVGDVAIDGVGGAGLIIKSTDGDKSILWRSTCDAWQVKGKDGYNVLDVSGIIFNGDCDHLISGAYKAGSGLSLHGGLEFNVGNMFRFGPTSTPSYTKQVHLNDVVGISGVSGISAVYSNGTVGDGNYSHTLYLDPTELSGILSGGSTASLTEVSGILDNYIDFVSGEFVSGSGALNNKIGNYTLLTDFTSGSGALNNQFVSGSGHLNSDIIGVSGMFVSGSGALNNKIDEIDEGGVGVITVSGMFVSGSGALHNEIVSSSGQFLTGSGLSMGKNVPFQLETDGSGNFRTIGFHGTFDGAAPASTNNQLYAQGSNLYWHGTQLDTGTGATNLAGLTDVDSSMSPSNEEVLIYRGSEWSSSASSSGILRAGIVFNSGELIIASGALRADIITNATDIATNVTDIASNATNFVSGSGALDNYIDFVSGEFVSGSGALNNRIDGLDTDGGVGVTTVSGMFVSGSGALNNKIDTNVTNIATNNTNFVSGSGALENMIHVSGLAISGLLPTAGSGLIRYDNVTLNLNDPSVDYSAITAANAVGADQILVWDDSISSWKHISLTELNAEMLDSAYVSDGTVDPGADYVLFLDGGGTGAVKKESWVDFANLIAGDNIDTDDDGVLDGNAGGVGGDVNQDAFSYIKINDNADISSAPQIDAAETTDTVDFRSSDGIVITSTAPDVITWSTPDIATASGALRQGVIFNSGELIIASGALRADIITNTTNIATNATDIVTASGALRAGVVFNSGELIIASGALRADITTNATDIVTASGALREGVVTVSGMFVSGSGALNNQFVSGSGALNNQFVSGSGALDNYIDFVSGEFVSGSGALSNRIDLLGGVSALNDLTDVTLAGLADGHQLRYNGANWENAVTASGALNNQFVSGSGALDNYIDFVSGEFVSGSGALNSRITTLTADSGLIRVGDEFRIDQSLLSSGNGFMVALGTGLGGVFDVVDGLHGKPDNILIGRMAGYHLPAYGATVGNNVTAIGSEAGWEEDSCQHVNMIGYRTGYQATGCTFTTMIGWSAGSNATGCNWTNMIGYRAGYLATGCNNTQMIGSDAGYNATGCYSVQMIGNKAGYAARDITKSSFMGFQAGEATSEVLYSSAVGLNAARFASGVENGVFLGRDAGSYASGVFNFISIGNSAGAYANGDDYTTNIGVAAGYAGSGSFDAVSIGSYAGQWATKSLQSIALGRQTQQYASGVRSFIAIGNSAGVGASGWQNLERTNPYIPGHTDADYNTSLHKYSIAIGQFAAQRTENTNQLIAIGRRAGAFTYDAEHIIAMGYRAGIQRKENNYSIYIGNDAGSYSSLAGDTPSVGGGSYQLFIGNDAGRFNTGNKNISIINGYAGDAINAGGDPLATPTPGTPVTHSDCLNIANLMYGRTGSTGSANKKLMIGHIASWTGASWSAPHDHLATLHVVPADAAHNEVCLHLAAAQNSDTITDRLNSTGYTGHGQTNLKPVNAINARMTTKTSTRDTLFGVSSDQYPWPYDLDANHDSSFGGNFFNTDGEGNTAVIGQRGLPIVPSVARVFGRNATGDSAADGYPRTRQQLLLWFNTKFDPYDYEIGTMIFVEFHHGPSNEIWPYLMILGHDNGAGMQFSKWRYIPMPQYDVVDGHTGSLNNTGSNAASTVLDKDYYGVPQRPGGNSGDGPSNTVKNRWSNGFAGDTSPLF